MTPHQISLIQKSWAEVEPIQDTAAGLFYQRLFVLEPAVRPMFKGDMREQGLGSKFTDEVKTAWATTYGTLAQVMKDAAYAPA